MDISNAKIRSRVFSSWSDVFNFQYLMYGESLVSLFPFFLWNSVQILGHFSNEHFSIICWLYSGILLRFSVLQPISFFEISYGVL